MVISIDPVQSVQHEMRAAGKDVKFLGCMQRLSRCEEKEKVTNLQGRGLEPAFLLSLTG
jgi:hypothetical protein